MNSMDRLAELTSHLGSPTFEAQFYAVGREMFDTDQSNVFSLNSKSRPRAVLSAANERVSQNIIARITPDYVGSGYKSDQTLAWGHKWLSNGHKRLVRRLCAEEISCKTYRHKFYDDAYIRGKLAMIWQGDGQILYVNFYRNSDQKGFTVKDENHLDEIGGLLCSLYAKHLQLVHPPKPVSIPTQGMTADFREVLLNRLRQVLLGHGVGLTPKEADICASIVLGVTAEGISLEHGISINTVATHRKRAYAKLGISSQNELFALYYESVTDHIRESIAA